MHDVVITTADQTDLDEVAELFNLYRVFYDQADDPAAARAFIRERMDLRESVILLARHQDRAAGFTQLYPVFSSVRMFRSWLLNDLFVHPDKRRLGVGRSLMNAAIEHARATGYRRVELETAVDNVSAQRLYESLGFTVGEGFHHYSIDLQGGGS